MGSTSARPCGLRIQGAARGASRWCKVPVGEWPTESPYMFTVRPGFAALAERQQDKDATLTESSKQTFHMVEQILSLQPSLHHTAFVRPLTQHRMDPVRARLDVSPGGRQPAPDGAVFPVKTFLTCGSHQDCAAGAHDS